MGRPLLLTSLPSRFRLSLFARHYRRTAMNHLALYEKASLEFAPQIFMQDLIPGDVISDYIAFTGIYELKTTRRVAALARQGGVMVDVGANLGYFSLLWAAASRKNRVIAFEPSPRNVDLLRRNIQSNSLQSQIDFYPAAAGKQAASLPFEAGDSRQTGWGGLMPKASNNSFQVDVRRVDEVLVGYDEVALLKIDVEGADTWALLGCERLIKEHRIREIWFEQYKPRMRQLGIPESLANEFLTSYGYKLRAETNTDFETVEWSAVPG